MKALAKILFGDALNVIGVAVLVALAVGLTGAGRAEWAVFAMPVAGLCVVAWLARH
jgi:uncharacterized membrane protein